MKKQYPILEFDPMQEAILEPSHMLSAIDIAEHCVLCFFQDVISHLKDAGQLVSLFASCTGSCQFTCSCISHTVNP